MIAYTVLSRVYVCVISNYLFIILKEMFDRLNNSRSFHIQELYLYLIFILLG